MCFFTGVDWTFVANQVTAWSTFVLAVGVVFAALQYFGERKNNRVVETNSLLRDWQATRLQIARTQLDNNVYRRLLRLQRFKAFRDLEVDVYNFIQDTARISERMEILVRRGAADEGIIVEHIGYDILVSYYILRDVLQDRAAEDDLNYEGFRDLARRTQDYAKLHPLDADLRDKLVFANLPPLRYRGGDVSLRYRESLRRRARLFILWCWWKLRRNTHHESLRIA